MIRGGRRLTTHVDHCDAEFLPGPAVLPAVHFADDFLEFIQPTMILGVRYRSYSMRMPPTLLALWDP